MAMRTTAGSVADGAFPNAATPAGKLSTPAPTIPLTKLKTSFGIVAPPSSGSVVVRVGVRFFVVRFGFVVHNRRPCGTKLEKGRLPPPRTVSKTEVVADPVTGETRRAVLVLGRTQKGRRARVLGVLLVGGGGGGAA